MSYGCKIQGTMFSIPKYMEQELITYAETGKVYTGFLIAVLSNDLKRAVELADEVSLVNLPAYVAYIVNKLPMSSQGSLEAIDYWYEYKQSQLGESNG